MHIRITQLLLLLVLASAEGFSQTFTDGPSVAVNADERLEIFTRGSDGALWHNWQTSPGGAWAGWYSLGGGIIGTPAATVNADGRLDVFVLGGGNAVYRNYQTSPGGGWSGWIGLAGSIAAPPTVAKNADGRLELFAKGTDCAGWHSTQTIPGGDFGPWSSFGGCIAVATSPSAIQNVNGALEIFTLGGGNTAFHAWQSSPGGGWGTWSSLGGSIATSPNAAINNDGRLEIFAQGTDNTAWHASQITPGGGWSSWNSLAGGISGSPLAEADGTGSLMGFVVNGSGYPYYNTQANGWPYWNYLGGATIAPPGIGMNFDGRLEIFGIGTDGNVYHNWQLSAGGSWSGWQSLGASSDSAGTDTLEDVYFLSDADNDTNYASRRSQQCPSNIPNLWRGPLNGRTYAWPCGAIVNVGLSSYKHLKPFNGAIANWNNSLAAYYAQYAQGGAIPLPAGLSISAGGPQTISVYPVCDTCIPSDTGYGRGQNTSFAFDPSNRLLHVDIRLIKGMTNGTALKDTFAHELGHSFGLLDCDVSARDGSGNPLFDCSKSVMATNISVSAHGWDYWAKNASNGATPSGGNIKLLSGPTNCDLSVIDQGLPDYRQCFKLASLPPDKPTCTNGAALGFADTGGLSSTYTCGNAACDGCNSNCNNFAPQNCGNGGGQPACSQWCGSVCMDTATCSCSGESPTCDENAGGYFPSCDNNCSPIVLDTFDEGFHFTGIGGGVRFRVTPNGPLLQMSWPDQSWRNGWLALDRNGNGKIDDFTELFGNVTPQPVATDPNGYLALAVFDDPMNGGNGNRVLDPNDSVYDHLLLWIDANHNGISEREELRSLREMGIFRIDLKYHRSNYVDGNGNHFRYRARVWDDTDKSHDICYDVFLSMEAQVATGSH